jgi:CysZ protein
MARDLLDEDTGEPDDNHDDHGNHGNHEQRATA